MLRGVSIIVLVTIPFSMAFADPTIKNSIESDTHLHVIGLNPTKTAISMNPVIDDIQASDPRLKSVIMYANHELVPVKIYYFSKNNMRYANKVAQLLKNSQVSQVSVIYSLPSNYVDQNIIQIFLGDTNGKSNQSESPVIGDPSRNGNN